MPIAFRNRDVIVPGLTPLRGLRVAQVRDPAQMALVQGRTESEMQARFDVGHRAYVAELDGVPAAWGWVATAAATIGEVQASFMVPRGERYLWNFVTLAAFRGQGVYPRLLEAIIATESVAARGFWIAWAPENHASGAGIRKAGFDLVAELSFDPAGKPVVKDMAPGGGRAAAAFLGLPEVRGEVARCWKCVRKEAAGGKACKAGECRCDYQRPEVACAGGVLAVA